MMPNPQIFNNQFECECSPGAAAAQMNDKLNFCNPQMNEKINFQPRTQERETIIFKRDGFNISSNPTIFSSQPCYAIPADAAYFYSDRIEVFLVYVNLRPDQQIAWGP